MKFLSVVDYFFYRYIYSKIPFSPGNKIRSLYFKLRMQKRFGDKIEINESVEIGNINLIEIDDGVTIKPRCLLGYAVGGKIHFKKNVLVGHDVIFINNMHEFKDRKKRVQDQGYQPFKDTVIGANTWIGARAIIMPGVTIGDHSVIGAGAIVTKNIPSYSIAAGVPAKVIRRLKK